MIDLSTEEWREAYRLVKAAAAQPDDDAARAVAFDFLRTAESKRLLALAHLLQPGATARTLQAALVPLERVDTRAKITDGEMGIRTTDAPGHVDKAPFTVVADNVRSAFNMGGIFRTADFFGAERIILCGYSPTPENPQVRKTALGADVSTPWEHIPDVRDAIYTTDIEGLDIIPSHIDLVGAEIEMLNLPNRERILSEILSPMKGEYDYILIDCSPSLGLITVNALTAADSVIIPVQCEYFALEGISKLLNTIKIIKSKLNPSLEIEGFLLTMYDSRLRLANQIYDEVKKHFQELVFKTVIQRNVKLSEAPSHGLPVILYDTDSTGAKNHLALAKEIIEKEK